MREVVDDGRSGDRRGYVSVGTVTEKGERRRIRNGESPETSLH